MKKAVAGGWTHCTGSDSQVTGAGRTAKGSWVVLSVFLGLVSPNCHGIYVPVKHL